MAGLTGFGGCQHESFLDQGHSVCKWEKICYNPDSLFSNRKMNQLDRCKNRTFVAVEDLYHVTKGLTADSIKKRMQIEIDFDSKHLISWH